jgi:glutamine synthetase
VYGSCNELRLTGKHETQSIDKFSFGVSDRGASIRIPQATAVEWKGYLEDRRPASNANPYEIVKVIQDSISLAEELIEK